MDVVVNTGVLVEAMSPEKSEKTSLKAIRALLTIYEKCDRLVLSKEIREEYYRKFKEYERRKFNFNVPRYLSYLESIGKIKYVEGEKISEVKIDPDDIKFIAVALKTISKIIISSQSDFLSNQQYLMETYNIRVSSPQKYHVVSIV